MAILMRAAYSLAMAPSCLYPEIEPFAHGELSVSDLHTIYYEQAGNPAGIPVLFVHGGPGAGCSEMDRRFFDPDVFRVVLFDQRGCGRSKPFGELEDNSTEALIADIESLRETLGIDTWHVFGGSWGSTLGLAYAESHPGSILSLVLRGIWLFRDADLDWWFYGLRNIRPELWRAFASFVPEAERADLLESYWHVLTGKDEEMAKAAAKAWSIYEGSACTLLPNPDFVDLLANDETSWALARLEAHYFRNQRFDPDDRLIRDLPKLKGIPACIVHGRYDIVCPIENADTLHQAWPESSFVVVDDAGHSSHEPGIAAQLVKAMDRIAATGSPKT